MLRRMSIVSTIADSVRPTPLADLNWRLAMKQAIRDGAELCRVLQLPDESIEPARAAARQFGLFAPRQFVARMERGNPRDPLLMQVLPLGEELIAMSGFTADPVGDLAAARAPGLLHKYHGRVLLIVTGACPVHCRYCFRRHFPYGEAPRGIEQFSPALETIAADVSIEEVILSGGDPLTVVDAQLSELVQALAGVSHVRRLRVHTRMPIMIPQRVTPEMLAWLTGTRLAPIVVVHANHPREIDESVGDALARLADAGVTLLNQSVLLRGVNDDARVLMVLSERLLDARVVPYYLHQLDRVAGAAHFAVPTDQGRELIKQMRLQLPGYAVPRYVRETVGEMSKTVLE